MASLARKTTRKEKREYERLRDELEKLERQEAAEDRKYLRWKSKMTGRDYFRYPDGRLGYSWSRAFSGFGFGVDLDDPKTQEVMSKTLRKWARYDLVDGRLELSEKGRKEMEAEKEAEKNRKPEWHKARDYVPTGTGKYRCITEVGFLKKKVVEQDVHFYSVLSGGRWQVPKGTRVVYWFEEGAE